MKGKRWETTNKYPKPKLTKSPSNTGSIFHPPSFTETDAPRDKL